LLPASLVLAIGGASVAVLLFRRQIVKTSIVIVALMIASVLCAVFWVFPYLETFKSPRPFARAIAQLVPPSAPLYIFADSMHDFNYYAERDSIPVLSSPLAVARILTAGQPGFLLVRERDFTKLAMLPRSSVIASESKERSPWHLLRISSAPQTATTKRK
jgi:hypothetical protein